MRIAIILILLMTVVLAQPPKMVDPKEKELDALMAKSQDRLKKITILTKQIDKMSSSKVSGMKESIETLQEEKIQLKNELQETKAVVEFNSTDKSTPFNLEPIVSDSTN
jgi:ABC-type phosphate transport system auxiliary subunit